MSAGSVTRLLRLLCLACWLVFGTMTQAGTLAVVLSDDTGPYREFAQALRDQLGRSPWTITSSARHDTVDLATRTDLIVTAGSEALQRTLARGGTSPVLATLITRGAYEQALAQHAAGTRRISAIYLDQPVLRQAALIRQLLPNAHRVGLLVRRDQIGQGRLWRTQLGTQLNLTLEIEESEGEATLLPSLGALLPRVDVLLALPDPKVVGREGVRPLLMTALRYQRPVIGYSAAMVTAGALAALYSTPAQIAQQTADLILGEGERLPPPQYALQYSLAFNRAVAEAFGIELRDESVIRRALGRYREGP